MWRAVVAVCCLLWFGESCLARTVELTTAIAVKSSAWHPAQVDLTSGTILALPDNWARTRPGRFDVVWYSIQLDAALELVHDRTALALVIPRAAEESDFWLNGERLEPEAGIGAPHNRTLWIDLPTSVRASGNVLTVRIAGRQNVRSGLSAIRVGPASELRLGYETRRLFQSVTPLVLIVLVAIAFFAALPLWLKTRRAPHLMFVALCALWLPRWLMLASPAAAFPDGIAVRLIVILSSLAATMLIALLAIEYLAVAGGSWRRYRRVVLACSALSAIAAIVWATVAPLTPIAFGVLHWPIFVLLIGIGIAHVRDALLTPQPVRVFTAIALIAWAITTLHDFALIHDLTDFDSFYWSPGAVLLVFLALIWRTVESLAVARGHADEEVRHAVTRERANVIAAERERLLHDLHDGMGGHLITALRMARREDVPREQVARVIEDSLEDMRLIIDSLDIGDEERDLLAPLGNLRYRLEPRLNAIGMTLGWDVEPLPEIHWLTPETALAIVRIVQEAVTNAVRHGAARTITIGARATTDTVELSIADDGVGFNTAQATELSNGHRGLQAMHARASKLGASLRIESGNGTRVALTLPLSRS